MDLLARREHTRLELERKLLARSHPRDTTDTVLDGLEADGLLDEARFVESFISTRIGKGQGPERIRADLVQRGVKGTHIEAGLQEARADWSALAAEARRKRFGSDVPGNFSERARQTRFLRYRGFESGHIEAALDLIADCD